MRSNAPEFPDVPGSYHGKSEGVSYADGHAALHKWWTAALAVPVAYGVAYKSVKVAADNADWIWLRDHASVKE